MLQRLKKEQNKTKIIFNFYFKKNYYPDNHD